MSSGSAMVSPAPTWYGGDVHDGPVRRMTATVPAAAERFDPYAVGGPVVVGIDGTSRSVTALRWAAEEAWRRYTEVVAVRACDLTPTVASYAPVHPPEQDPERRVEEESEDLVRLVREALGAQPPVPVRAVCERTTPVRALLAHSAGASMLVLATSVDLTTGTGLGSTALACLRHAPCPVVVLPAEPRS